MKTLLVGDLHLKARLMLPIIERKTYELKCKRIIFIGDYVDDYFQEFNVELFINDLNYLLNWKRKMESKGINCIFLLGNHDAAYLTNQPRAYSLQDKNFFIKTRNLLFELELQVAFR
ncbi:metallophosphoesterase, partial [Enterococcus faecalis]|nr:metallophosphoesterase [Enterococcus faecalis]